MKMLKLENVSSIIFQKKKKDFIRNGFFCKLKKQAFFVYGIFAFSHIFNCCNISVITKTVFPMPKFFSKENA